jgi:glycosyltransferase involved in cell wall biosynthesis
MEALITTLIPTYRRPESLVQAIQSVQMQTEKRICIAVFDNASGDSTESVVRALAAEDPRIEYHCNEVNIGVTGNYEKAMRSVRTPYFSLFADDDELKPEFYASALEVLQRNPECGFCGGVTEVRKGDSSSWYWPQTWREGVYESPEAVDLLVREHITCTSVLFSSFVLDTVGVLDPRSQWYGEHHYELRVALKHPVCFVSQIFARWNEHPYPQRTDGINYFRGALHVVNLAATLAEDAPAAASIVAWAERELQAWARQIIGSASRRHQAIWGMWQILAEWSRTSALSRERVAQIKKGFVKTVLPKHPAYQLLASVSRPFR